MEKTEQFTMIKKQEGYNIDSSFSSWGGREGGRNSTSGINRFLIIFNSHQIELTGVTSSATHGVINEIMGINFD